MARQPLRWPGGLEDSPFWHPPGWTTDPCLCFVPVHLRTDMTCRHCGVKLRWRKIGDAPPPPTPVARPATRKRVRPKKALALRPEDV